MRLADLERRGLCLRHQTHDATCHVCCLYAVAEDNRTLVCLFESPAGPMWVLLEPAEPGLNDWPEPTIAHCLDIDVVAQGASYADAFLMLREAVAMCIEDDAAAQLDVRDRRTTPAAEWQRLASIIAAARKR